MSAVNFVPNPGKPHIKINSYEGNEFFLWAHASGADNRLLDLAKDYCLKLNHGEYGTRGEAARALFNYKGEEK